MKSSIHWLCSILILVVNVVDIILEDRDNWRIRAFYVNLIYNKDIGKLRYFIGIEMAKTASGTSLPQKKFNLDNLEYTGLLWFKPVNTPMDTNLNSIVDQGELIKNPRKYRDVQESQLFCLLQDLILLCGQCD